MNTRYSLWELEPHKITLPSMEEEEKWKILRISDRAKYERLASLETPCDLLVLEFDLA